MDFDNRIKNHATSGVHCKNCAFRSRCVVDKISEKEVDILSSSHITRSSFKEGHYLYRRGDDFAGVYSLRFGAVKTELLFRSGTTQVTNFAIPGALLGLDGIGNAKHQLDCVCLSPTEVCFIPIPNVDKMIKDYPELMNNVGGAVGVLLNSAHAHNYDLINLNSLERLADFLISYSNHLSMVGFDRDEFNLTMSRPDLANYLGVTVETLSRSLSHLEKIGAIEVTNRHIKFLSRVPIFELLDARVTREKHDSEKDLTHRYPTFVEKRKI